MGSRTVWQRVYDDPDDRGAWGEFWCHYTAPVFNWARRWVSHHAAEDVAGDVFLRLRQRVRSDKSKRVEPGGDGSYRQYVWAVVRSAAVAALADEARQLGKRVPEEALRAMASEQSLDGLEGEVRDYAGLEADLARHDADYTQAVRELRAGPQFNEQSFGVFLRVHRSGEDGVAAAIDEEMGWSRGMASKAARRVCARLAELMRLPSGTDSEKKRGCKILSLMVQRHGDPS